MRCSTQRPKCNCLPLSYCVWRRVWQHGRYIICGIKAKQLPAQPFFVTGSVTLDARPVRMAESPSEVRGSRTKLEDRKGQAWGCNSECGRGALVVRNALSGISHQLRLLPDVFRPSACALFCLSPEGACLSWLAAGSVGPRSSD